MLNNHIQASTANTNNSYSTNNLIEITSDLLEVMVALAEQSLRREDHLYEQLKQAQQFLSASGSASPLDDPATG